MLLPIAVSLLGFIFQRIKGASFSNAPPRQVIVVAGNFTLNNVLVNFAQYDVDSGLWSTQFEPDLYLYGESNGVVWDIAVNTSSVPYNKLIVVGAFDTVARTSQVQFCSVGSWDGFSFGKVGEGLCPRGGDSSATMFIQTTAFGNDGDLFVGGTFESRVWDGKHFVNVVNIAHFNDKLSSWLPLLGGPLSCDDSCTPKVNALAWDAVNSVLYIGGVFNMIDDEPIPPGIAMWSEKTGLMAFPGGGVTLSTDSPFNVTGNLSSRSSVDGKVMALQFESRSQSLFVSGSFHYVNNTPCTTVAVWEMSTNTWTCLYDPIHGISTVTAMLYENNFLFLAGWAAPSSSWDSKLNLAPYTIAVLDIRRYIEDRYKWKIRSPTSVPSPSSFGNSSSNSSCSNCPLNGNDSNNSDTERSPTKTPHSSYGSRRRLRSRGAARSHLRFHGGRRAQGAEVSRKLVTSILPVHNTFNTTSTPSPTPAKGPWTMEWAWLPAFPGGNGPILRLMMGEGDYAGCLFITGAFNNLPAVAVWTNSSAKGPSLSGMGPGDQLRGLIAAMQQVSLPMHVSPPTTIPPVIPVKKQDRFYLTLMICLSALVLLAVGFAIGCVQARSFIKLPFTSPINEMSGGEELMISLKTLSGSANAVVDFRDVFERAMMARHLPAHENLLVINPKEIMLWKIIGEGSFGRVWSGKWKSNNVAVKEFVFAQAAMAGGSLQRDSIIEEIVGEAGIMAFLRHPKILQIYGCSLTMQAIWIVSELCSRGSLRMLLNDRSVELTLAKKLSLCLDVADGMLYLHTRCPPIIHRDIKSHNLFISEPSPGNFIAKIGDWGSARAVALGGSKTLTHGVGTACWLAPEVINFAHSSKSSDVFAFGIVLWEMYTRLEVYEGLSAAQIIAKVAHDHLRPQVPRDCPWAGIMTECWKQNANERPGFHTIMATLGKLYARCKAAGGKSRGFGMTSVSSSPAISTMGTNNSLNSRSTFTRGLLSLKNSLYIPSYLSKTASAIETGRPLNTAKDYGSKYASAGARSRIRSNPDRNVPFNATYLLKSDDDAGREGVNPYEESGYCNETDPLIKSGRSNASNFGQNDYQVSAETFQRRSNDSSSGSSGRYSSKSSTALRNKADSRQSSIPKKSTIPSDYRSSGVESSQSFVIEDNVPFSSAREKDDSIMGQDFIDWNEIPDENAVDKAGLAFSRQETPMVFRYGKDPMDSYQTTSPLETGTRETSPAGLQDVGSFRTHEYSLTKETSEDVSTSRPVARRSSSGDTYILPGKSGK